MIHNIVTCVVLLVLFAAAPAPKWTQADKEKECLQGSWRSNAAEGASDKVATDALVITFDKDRFVLKQHSNVIYNGTYTIDPSKEPKTINLFIEGPRHKEVVGKSAVGIYRLEKDKLCLCFEDPEEASAPRPKGAPPPPGRPTEFKVKDDSHYLIIFKRVNP